MKEETEALQKMVEGKRDEIESVLEEIDKLDDKKKQLYVELTKMVNDLYFLKQGKNC